MGRALALLGALVAATSCGRLGFELAEVEQGEAGAGGRLAAGGATADAASGGVEAGAGGAAAGGQAGAGGTGTGGTGAGDAGTGGISTGGTSVSDASAGGTSPGDAGSGGQPGSGGQAAADGGYTCTPGALELCDGRDNDCDLLVDEGGACSAQCGGRAWGGHGYMLCEGASDSWQEARAGCEAAGMDLVRIDSQAENDFLYTFAFGGTRRAEVWVGGNDLTAEGDWQWADGTSFWSGTASPVGGPVGGAYTHWYDPGEPNDQNGALNAEGDCLAFIELQQGSWIDQGCNYFRRYICETP